ncbi:MAG: hypothetical protein RBS57_16630 [Desulforhabdus sp.]|jgi:hypothetical protein|nr:hypothetical protein [Desulforhabdus sp.]
MFSRSDIERFADACKNISNEIADETGFVSVRNLLSRFQAKLLIRPLLVEGMLASDASGKWAVLVDSETYPVSEHDIEKESVANPLPSRLRNTIAHELVHSFAFRPTEFGVRLSGMKANGDIHRELLNDIERHTENLSPLLLVPECALERSLSRQRSTLTADDLIRIIHNLGVSRYVLVNRLRMIPLGHRLRLNPALQNVAIGIGAWDHTGKSLLRKWPIFTNFEQNLIPDLILKLQNQDNVPADAAFDDPNFLLCGGKINQTKIHTYFGTMQNPHLEKNLIKCTVESKKIANSSFIYTLHRI